MEWNSDAQRLEALLLSLSDAAEELAEAYADEEDSEEWRKVRNYAVYPQNDGAIH